MKRKLIYYSVLVLLLTGFLIVGSASAVIYEFNDSITEFDGYHTPLYGVDVVGNPDLLKVQAGVDNNCLKGIGVYYDPDQGAGLTNTGDYNSFFIDAHSTGFDWDYYVKLENTSGKYDQATFKATLYNLPDNWSYTLANVSGDRIGHPNGIDTTGLTGTDLAVFGVAYGANVSNEFFNIVGVGFDSCGINLGDQWSLAVTQYCANDNFQQPVPEPATLLLLGSGMIALAAFRRKKK